MHAVVHAINIAYFFHVFCNESRSTIINPIVCGQSTSAVAVTVTYIEIALRSLTQSYMCLVLYKYGAGAGEGKESLKSVSPEYFVSFKYKTSCAISKQKGILLTDALKRSDRVFLL